MCLSLEDLLILGYSLFSARYASFVFYGNKMQARNLIVTITFNA